MTRRTTSRWVSYLLAAIATALAAVAGALLARSFGTGVLYVTLLAAVTFAAWRGGFGPALLATTLAYLIGNLFFTAPGRGFVPRVESVAFIFGCISIAALSEAMRRARRRAEASAERVVAIVEGLTDGFIAVDAEGHCAYMNRAAMELGRRQPEGEGDGAPWGFFPFTMDGTLAAILRRTAEDRMTVTFEHYCQAWDTWFELKATPHADGGLAIFMHDVSERKRAEQERLRLLGDLEAKNAFTADVLRQVPAGVLVADAKTGEVVFRNDEARAVIPHDPPGTAVSEDRATQLQGFHPDGQPYEPDQLPLRRALGGEEVTGEEITLVAPDGSKRTISVNSSPIRDRHDEIIAAVVAFHDITARIEMEKTLRESDRRKDEFLATLAHELRNPLAPISNALQLWPLLETDRQEMEHLREMMERQVRQMIRLIDDLMDVSRITRGKIQLRKEQVELGMLISGAVESIQPFIDACNHRLHVELPDEPVFVEGDVARLTQVFGNILHNAAKYTGRDGTIWVTVQRQGDRAVCSIKDTGPGIPADMLGQIFDMFQQVDQTLARSHGGLGIGLTLVKRLIDLHGGSIEARSEGIGNGSQFIISLPALAPESVDRDEPKPRRAHKRLAPLPRHRILVVDDVKASANTLAMMLRSMEQDVCAVHDGPAAIEWVKANHPDLVFLDIAMPGMDGYEVARRIRQRAHAGDISLVALTGYGQEEDRRRAIESGFNHHMTKPTNMEALEHVLLTFPGHKSQPSASQPV